MCCSCCIRFFFFFFKQKAAYEVRISDWSSDVCSSDLTNRSQTSILLGVRRSPAAEGDEIREGSVIVVVSIPQRHLVAIDILRSEERRVGKECVSTCRSRWATVH